MYPPSCQDEVVGGHCVPSGSTVVACLYWWGVGGAGGVWGRLQEGQGQGAEGGGVKFGRSQCETRDTL